VKQLSDNNLYDTVQLYSTSSDIIQPDSLFEFD